MQPVTSKRVNNILLFLGVIMLFSIISAMAINAAFSVTDEIFSGVKVADIDLGGLTIQAAETKITAVFRERTTGILIILTHDNQQWTISASEIDLAIDPAVLARQAYAVGRTGSQFARIQEKFLAINRGHNIPAAVSFDAQKLRAIVINIANTIDQKPQNAAAIQANSTVSIKPEVSGIQVDVDKTVADITARLETIKPYALPLAVNYHPPVIRVGDLAGIDAVLASYSTRFNQYDQNRSENVALAARSINGLIIKQGEPFSFNAQVGLRTAKFGYKIAPVYINGKLVPDWGGGVCQVSSTLYNAALLADLTIAERTAHFHPPAYVPLGQDATVVDNYLDLKLLNNTGHNIYVASEVVGNKLTVTIFGKMRPNTPQIQIESSNIQVLEPKTVIKKDPNLELGKEVIEDEGQQGYQLATYRVKYFNNTEISRELLAADDFRPEDKVVRVGTKPPVQLKSK